MHDAGRTTIQTTQGSAPRGPDGDSKPDWLKIAGIGCAVVVLVGGLILGLAVFRTAACCSEFGKLAETASQVQQEGYELAGHLHRGEYQQAYERLDDTAKQKISAEEFEQRFAQVKPQLQQSEPFPVRLDIDQEDFDIMEVGDLDRWYLTTHFAEPQFNEMLQLRLVAHTQPHDDEVVVGILDWEVDRIEHQFEDHSYARTATTFLDRIERGNYEDARRMISPEGRLSGVSDEELAEELRSVTDLLVEAEHGRVYGLYPESVETLTARTVVYRGDEALFIDVLVDWQDRVHGVSEPRAAGHEQEDEQQEDERSVENDEAERDGAESESD